MLNAITHRLLLYFLIWVSFIPFAATSLEATSSSLTAQPFTITTFRERYKTRTDVDAALGSAAESEGLTITCPSALGTLTVVATFDNPAFTTSLQQVSCGSVTFARITFKPTAIGITTSQLTINTSAGSATVSVIGNGVVVETAPYWIADLGPGTSIFSEVYDDQRQLLYLSDSGNNQIIIFSPITRTVIKRITVGQEPFGMALTPDASRLYVANTGELKLTEIDLNTQTKINDISIPSLYPNPTAPYQQFYTPYTIAVVSETLALLGGNPPGGASGGPIYEIDLRTNNISPRTDLGQYFQAARPVFRVSRDFSTVGIVAEPGSSPTNILRYDVRSNSFTKQSYQIERSIAVNNDGSKNITTFHDCNTQIPNLSVFDQQLTLLNAIQTLGCQTLAVAFNPSKTNFVYGLDDRAIKIEEVDLDEKRQTRLLSFDVPSGYGFLPFNQPLVASSDGQWIYAPLIQTFNAPPSKLLALFVGSPKQVYLPYIRR